MAATTIGQPVRGMKFWARRMYTRVDDIDVIAGEVYVSQWPCPTGVDPTIDSQYGDGVRTFRVPITTWPVDEPCVHHGKVVT